LDVELKSFTYTSWARPGISAEEVQAIISSSQVNNPLDGITGVLVFNGTAFMQILEGSEAAVDELVCRLARDPRHSNMSARDERLIARRTFPDWSMGYLRLENGQFEGAQAVARALDRDLSPKLRNTLLGLTQALVKAGHPD
jgi:hypothetical protein